MSANLDFKGWFFMRQSLILLALMSAVATAPLAAQTPPIDQRVGKLEREMRAVQRKVFPGGPQIQPEIGPLDTGDAGTAAPASAPLTDLTSRVDALEAQLRMLTGQVETDGNRLRKLEEALKAFQSTTDTRLKALEPTPPPVVTETPAPTMATPAPTASGADVETGGTSPVIVENIPQVVTPPRAPPAAAPRANPAPPQTAAVRDVAARKALVDAVEVPASGDAAEDAYSYGFRLWQAKLYPESQAKLKDYISKYPRHSRISHARNLLGRSYLDEGKPALASVAFYENYTKNPEGARASESLYYLGVALTRLKKLPDACKVYDEFDDVYGKSASADLKARVAKGRLDAKCS